MASYPPPTSSLAVQSQTEWQESLMDCCSPVSDCCTGFWCPCILVGKTAARLRDPSMQSYETCNTDCAVIAAINFFTGCGWVYAMFKRTETREKLNIKGSVMGDFCATYWCTCCAVIQAEKESKARLNMLNYTGYQPMPKDGMQMPGHAQHPYISTALAIPLLRLVSHDSIRRKPLPAITPTTSTLSLTTHPAPVLLRPSLDSLAATQLPGHPDAGLGVRETTERPNGAGSGPGKAYSSLAAGTGRKTSGASSAVGSAGVGVACKGTWISVERLAGRETDDVASPVPRTVIARSGRQRRWRRIIQDWRAEIFGCLMALCCFIFIVLILAVYNKQPISSLPPALTINTILQFPLSILIFSLFLPITSCISQWKWLWFSPNPDTVLTTCRHPVLADIHHFDTASRHPFSFLPFLRRFTTTTPASLGVLLLALLPLVSPITHLAITYTHGTVVIPSGIARVATLQGLGNRTNDYQDLRKAASIGVLNWEGGKEEEDEVLRATLAVACSKELCRFPRVTNLGLCSAVADITGHLTQQQLSAQLFNLSDCSLDASSTPSFIACKTPSSTTFTPQPPDALTLYSMATIYHSSSSSPSFHALETIFSLCENTFSISVHANTTTITPVTTRILTAPDFPGIQVNCTLFDGNRSMALCRTGINNGVAQLGRGDGEGGYSVPYSALEMVALAVNPAVSGRWNGKVGGEDEMGNGEELASIAEVLLSSVKQDTAEKRMKRMVMSVSRSINATIFNGSTISTTASTTGTLLLPTTIITTTWPALALAIVLLLATSLFLSYTILAIHRAHLPTLKSSAIAYLVALDDDTRKALGSLDDVETLNEKAEVLRVVRDEDRIVLDVANMPRVSESSGSRRRREAGMKSIGRVEGRA